MMSFVKSSLKMSRTTRTASSGSPRRSVGALFVEVRFFSMSSHWRVRRVTSSRICSSEAPSAAVRTMTPEPEGTTALRIFFRRARSLSGSLREMPIMEPPGIRTR